MGDTKFRQTGRRTAAGPFRRDEQQRKRAEGEARNKDWQALSPQDQMTSLRKRAGLSKRQMKKLEALL